MKKSESVFTSFWFTLVMSVLAVVMLVNYVTLVAEGRSLLRFVGLVAWIIMAVYFIKTFMARLRERRHAQSE